MDLTKASHKTLHDLVYSLQVASVMSRNVVAVAPDTRMSDLRTILRDRRISGAPVTDASGLVGIVSVEDVLRWLGEEKSGDSTVERWMTREPQTIFDDEAVVHAIGRLKYGGFGRLPVLNRATGALVGLVTKGDVVAGLLEALQGQFRGERGAEGDRGAFLEDLTSGDTTLSLHCPIKAGPVERGGQAASSLRRALKALGVRPDLIRRAAIVLYEAEMNVVIYAAEGEISLRVARDTLHIEISDRGPGIPDIERAMEPGFSTAPDSVRDLGFGAGMGLPNIKRCATTMRLDSAVGEGTRLEVTITAGEASERSMGA